jgi:hypothetical protein
MAHRQYDMAVKSSCAAGNRAVGDLRVALWEADSSG